VCRRPKGMRSIGEWWCRRLKRIAFGTFRSTIGATVYRSSQQGEPSKSRHADTAPPPRVCSAEAPGRPHHSIGGATCGLD
jgi:hypothetical protein